MPVAAAVPAIIGAAGSIGGALIGSSASKGAANTIAGGQQQLQQTVGNAVNNGIASANTGQGNANATLASALPQQQAELNPYIGAGTDSLGDLRALTTVNSPLNQQFSFNPSDLQNDPGYQFTLQQGQQAIQRAAAAQGGLFSSGTLKSLANYSTGTANQYFNDAYNRALSTFNTNRQGALAQAGILQNLAGMGQSSSQLASQQLGQNYAQQAQNTYGTGQFNANLGIGGAQILGNSQANAANAQAAGQIGSANAWSSGLGGVTNSIGNFLTMRNLANGVGFGGGGYANSQNYGYTGNPDVGGG